MIEESSNCVASSPAFSIWSSAIVSAGDVSFDGEGFAVISVPFMAGLGDSVAVSSSSGALEDTGICADASSRRSESSNLALDFTSSCDATTFGPRPTTSALHSSPSRTLPDASDNITVSPVVTYEKPLQSLRCGSCSPDVDANQDDSESGMQALLAFNAEVSNYDRLSAERSIPKTSFPANLSTMPTRTTLLSTNTAGSRTPVRLKPSTPCMEQEGNFFCTENDNDLDDTDYLESSATEITPPPKCRTLAYEAGNSLLLTPTHQMDDSFGQPSSHRPHNSTALLGSPTTPPASIAFEFSNESSLLGFAFGRDHSDDVGRSSRQNFFSSVEASENANRNADADLNDKDIPYIDDLSLSNIIAPLTAALSDASRSGDNALTQPSPPKNARFRSPLKWKEVVQLSRLNNTSPSRRFAMGRIDATPFPKSPTLLQNFCEQLSPAAAEADLSFEDFRDLPYRLDDSSHPSNALSSTPSTKQAAEISNAVAEPVLSATAADPKAEQVFKIPAVAQRAKRKRPPKSQREQDAKATLGEPIEAASVGALLAQAFLTDLKRALYMHQSKLQAFRQLSLNNPSMDRITLVAKWIQLLCEEPAPWPSTKNLCEMLTLFLNAREAERLGVSDLYAKGHHAIATVWRILRYIATLQQPTTLRCVAKSVKSWLSGSATELISVEFAREKLLALLGKEKALWAHVSQMFPNERPADTALDNFEVLSTNDVLAASKTQADESLAPAFFGVPDSFAFEKVVIPVKPVDSQRLVGTKTCPCCCHYGVPRRPTGQASALVHCDLCSAKLVGRLFVALHNGKFVPAEISPPSLVAAVSLSCIPRDAAAASNNCIPANGGSLASASSCIVFSPTVLVSSQMNCPPSTDPFVECAEVRVASVESHAAITPSNASAMNTHANVEKALPCTGMQHQQLLTSPIRTNSYRCQQGEDSLSSDDIFSVRRLMSVIQSPPKSSNRLGAANSILRSPTHAGNENSQDLLKNAIRLCFDGASNLGSPIRTTNDLGQTYFPPDANDLNFVMASSPRPLFTPDNSIFIHGTDRCDVMLPNAQSGMLRTAENSLMGLSFNCNDSLGSFLRNSDFDPTDASLSLHFPPNFVEQGGPQHYAPLCHGNPGTSGGTDYAEPGGLRHQVAQIDPHLSANYNGVVCANDLMDADVHFVDQLPSVWQTSGATAFLSHGMDGGCNVLPAQNNVDFLGQAFESAINNITVADPSLQQQAHSAVSRDASPPFRKSVPAIIRRGRGRPSTKSSVNVGERSHLLPSPSGQPAFSPNNSGTSSSFRSGASIGILIPVSRDGTSSGSGPAGFVLLPANFNNAHGGTGPAVGQTASRKARKRKANLTDVVAAAEAICAPAVPKVLKIHKQTKFVNPNPQRLLLPKPPGGQVAGNVPAKGGQPLALAMKAQSKRTLMFMPQQLAQNVPSPLVVAPKQRSSSIRRTASARRPNAKRGLSRSSQQSLPEAQSEFAGGTSGSATGPSIHSSTSCKGCATNVHHCKTEFEPGPLSASAATDGHLPRVNFDTCSAPAFDEQLDIFMLRSIDAGMPDDAIVDEMRSRCDATSLDIIQRLQFLRLFMSDVEVQRTTDQIMSSKHC